MIFIIVGLKKCFLFFIKYVVFSRKKIKEGAQRLGQNTAKFAGKLNSLYKTFKPLINIPLDYFTGGVGSTVLGGASAIYDMFENRDDLSETQKMDLVEQGLVLLRMVLNIYSINYQRLQESMLINEAAQK